MRVDELFPTDYIDEDIKKMMGGAALGATLLAAPLKPVDDLVHHIGPAPQDVSILAKTMWGEARNQGAAGMEAIGHVIKNRAEAHALRFGIGIKNVALKSKQFSCWNPSDPNHQEMSEMQKIMNYIQKKEAPPGEKSFDEWLKKIKHSSLYPEYQKWLEAYNLAQKILSNKSSDPTGGALFYHTTNVHPNWAKGVTPVKKMADHIFYKTAKVDLTKKSS